jgi:hydroxymethylglutaryl-CoA synthase
LVIFPEEKVGIVGWGSYFPIYRISMGELERQWGFPPGTGEGLGMKEKAVAASDEDAVTMGYEAARNAILRAEIDSKKIGAVFFGTESKPYAVKPSATIVAQALGITPNTMASDLEFACRAASEGMRASIGLISSGMIEFALVIGSDTAQANPGDILEFTASSGATAFVLGPKPLSAAYFEASFSYITDTPDFWRRSLSPYPLHGEAFTGDPAYFDHIINAVRGLMEKTGLRPSDFDFAVFHQPNGKYPIKVGERLGFTKEKILPGLLTPVVGNTYNGSAFQGLSHLLDTVKPGTRILMAPFGSGAGSDAYSIVVTDKVENKKNLAPPAYFYVNKKVSISYSEYAKFRKLIKRIGGD